MAEEMKEKKRTMTMDFEGFVDDDDDDFFDAAVDSSSDSDEEFEDSRMSFTAVVSAAVNIGSGDASHDSSAAAAPVPERRKGFFSGMGMSSSKKLLKENSSNFSRKLTKKLSTKVVLPPAAPKAAKPRAPPPLPPSAAQISEKEPEARPPEPPEEVTEEIARTRSEGFIDAEEFESTKKRSEELIGDESKQKLKKTFSEQISPSSDLIRLAAVEKRKSGGSLSSVLANGKSDSFLLVRNLENGSEFVVNEGDRSGMWNKVRDLSTGKKVSVEEFEKSIGYSPVVKELMRRESISHDIGDSFKKFAHKSVFSKSTKPTKRKGPSLFKNLSTNLMISTKGSKHGDKDHQPPPPSPPARPDPKPNKTDTASSEKKDTTSSHWIKVRQSGKNRKDLSGLHMCQEIQAHEGSIWTLRFTPDGKYLASAGEDRTIHVWEVQECEVTSSRMPRTPEEGDGSMPLHPSASPAHPPLAEAQPAPTMKKKKWKKKNLIPDYVHVPETVFALSEKPACSFSDHTDDVLDLSWSKSQMLISSSMDKTVRLWDMETKSCVKTFSHNDYVTGIHFNPVDDNFFISGSLDGQVRIWNINDLSPTICTKVYEMVTAVCYSPNGQDALIGTHTGSYQLYGTDDCKLEAKGRVEIPNKNSQARKVTGFQFLPNNPSEVLVTCADSRIRIYNGEVVVHKFKGFRNTSSPIAASFCKDGKYVLSASEDSHVYLWKREGYRLPGSGIGKIRIKTASHEHFFCRDVSVAIPWPCNTKGEPSKKHSKRLANAQSDVTDSSTTEDNKEAGGQMSRQASTRSDSSGISNSDSSSVDASSSSQSSSSWSWWDGVRGHGSGEKVTAWGLVIVTAGLAGEIRVYQNFGLPRKLSHPVTLL